MPKVLGLRTKNGRNRARIHARGSLHAHACTGLGTRTHAPRTRTGVRRTTRPGPAAYVRVRGAKYLGHTRHAHFPGSGARRFPLAVTKSLRFHAGARRFPLAVTKSLRFHAGTRRFSLAAIVTRFTAKTYNGSIARGAKFLAFRDNPSHVVDEILKAAKNSREKLEEIYARCFQQTDLLYNI